MTATPVNDLMQFAEQVFEQKQIWLLMDQDDCVCCDAMDPSCDQQVVPLWSSQELAQAFCQDEWADYQLQHIELDEFLDEWIDLFNEESLLVGLDWQTSQQPLLEVSAIQLAMALADAEAKA